MDYSIGQDVVTPRGGMNARVASVDADGSVLATTDGGALRGVWCTHRDPIHMYFEYLGGPARGHHGWFDGAHDCRKVYQVG